MVYSIIKIYFLKSTYKKNSIIIEIPSDIFTFK